MEALSQMKQVCYVKPTIKIFKIKMISVKILSIWCKREYSLYEGLLIISF